jgi:flagellar L-ring protein FlgH
MINRFIFTVVLLIGLGACSSVPPSIVHQPMTALPANAHVQKEMNGAIFQSSSYRPLFEDNRARLIGDVLTVSISEKTSAGKAAASNNTKTGSTDFGVPKVLGLSSSVMANASISTSTSNKFDEKGAETASNNFSGTITVTVIDVLPNGNLLVSGEKQMAFDKGAEYVRFSGVVNPRTIAAGNTVVSSQVADARFEYRSTTAIDRSEWNSLLNRFFLSFVPL